MEKERLSISATEGKLTKSISVEQVENGFIINIEKYGDIPKKNCSCSGSCNCTEWFNETKRYISKTNPLSKDKKKETENLFDFINDMIILD